MGSVSKTNQIEKELKVAGQKLGNPFPSTKELLDHLDRVERLLSCVGQAPPGSMQEALVPSMGALINMQLLSHSDVDVRVSVAACLSEVTRITAPDAPYSDEIMKKIFQLNVMAFGKLSQMSGHCYSKATQILDSVANVKSFLLMLDLECDSLILQMFQHFLNSIRSSHPHSVFLNMESIMSLVIEESEDPPVQLLGLLLSSVRKEKQSVTPVSWNLAEKVLKNCADTLRSYLPKVMKSLNLDPDNYAEVIGLICRDVAGTKLKVADEFSNDGATPKEIGQAIPNKRDRKPSSLLKPEWGYNGTGSKDNDKVTCQDSEEKKISDGPKSSASREKSKGKKVSKAESERGSVEIKVASQFSMETTTVPSSAGVKKEDVVITDSKGAAEPLVQQVNKKNQKRDQATLRKHVAEGSGNQVLSGSEKNSSESSKGKSKKKSVLQREEDPKLASNTKDYGEELVGRRIMVWWPLDKKFYEGAVSSFDPSEKKHLVLYADGDEEMLNLGNESWKLIDDLSPHLEQAADHPGSAPVSEKQKKKRKRKSGSSAKLHMGESSPDLSRTEAAKKDIVAEKSSDEPEPQKQKTVA